MGRWWGMGALLSAFVAVPTAQTAWATMENFKSYKQAYPEKTKISCTVCHESAVATRENLNGYGKALQQLPPPANTKQLTVDDYRAAEAADPDQDGATTLQELTAGTDPSNPTSVPGTDDSAAETPASTTSSSMGE